MASVRKVTEKRHNPVDSICRKIRAIHRREEISDPGQHMIKHQASSLAPLPVPDPCCLNSEGSEASFLSPETLLLSTPSVSNLPSPEKATNSGCPTSTSRLSSQRNQSWASLVREGVRFRLFDLDSMSGQSCWSFTPQDSVVRKLTLNEDGWKSGADGGQDVPHGAHGARDREILTSIFRACDTEGRGSIEVGKVIDYLRQTSSQDLEDSGLEELWTMLDPEKTDPQVDLDTFHAAVKEWMAYCRPKWEGVKSRFSRTTEDSVFEKQDSINSVEMTTDITDSATGSLEALGGEMSQGVLDVSDLITYIADLHFHKQKLEEENCKFKLALETSEEANIQLTEDCAELRLQVKSVRQTVMRGNLLKEELEELKITLSVLEKEKSMTEAQNKQLETENRALILKIRILQEENLKNALDIDGLEKKIEELSETETEHQMQLHTYENTLLNKEKDLRIGELKSTIIEYRSIIENLRGEKNELAYELQQLQQELILNGIQLNAGREPSSDLSEGENSLCRELILAQSAENNKTECQCSSTSLSSLDAVTDQQILLFLRQPEQKGMEFTATLQTLFKEMSDVGTFIDSAFQWVTNPEITLKEKWVQQLTEFKHVKKKKLNLCRLSLISLGNHKESLDKVFVKLIEILKEFRLEYLYFQKEFFSRCSGIIGNQIEISASMKEEVQITNIIRHCDAKKRQKQLEAIKQLQEDAVNQEAILRKKVQEASKQLEEAKQQVKDRERTAHSASEKAKSLPHELEEAILEQRNLHTINTELSNTCQTLEQKTTLKTTIESLRNQLIKGRLHDLFQNVLDEESSHHDPLSSTEKIQQPFQEKLKHYCGKLHWDQEARIHQTSLVLKHPVWYTPLLDAFYLDSCTVILRLALTSFSSVASLVHASCERAKNGEIKDGALDVTRQPKCLSPTSGPNPGPDRSGCIRMNNDLSMEENGVERSYSESLPQPRKHRTLPSPGHASSTESTVTSSDSGSEILHMASGDLDSRSPCEKQETRSVSTMIETQGTSAAHENITCQDSRSKGKTVSNLEAKEEPKTIKEHRKECAAGETEVSSPPVATGKSLNFRQSDNTSANEKEVEAEFLRLSLGFKCDWFTLERRVKLEERSRDLAEENLKKEITNCLKLLESLTPLCEEDNQAQEIIKKLENSITFLSQCTTRVASRAEMLGAINQESRVSKAVEVMIQHVENLKRMYAKEHAELEELKQVLLQNERSFNPLEDEDDCQIKKRSASLNSKPSSLRRVTIASLPRNIGNAGMVAATENDRFSRRSSSWRILGSKQSEHRPSLHRFISTYSWADAEDERCELKTKDDSESPGEEIVERTRKPSLSERKNNPSKWDLSSVPHTLATWAGNLGTSVRKANKALWLSVAFIVLFAALMSLLTGRFFQKSVDAAPTQEGDSWISLEHILWPFTRLQHHGPPPV
ncbi:lymphoid-restricted membrane protein isoform X2 [Heterocephalus glaber]|uniref:Lymphoid-restricted membrane protein isoform X2 n=1 Tax=Heterocephalus glaber TaxID=10181 RepID=A0AAX6SZ03_HETGA|nr:lymphoid-restricted membrane protein isoform X2 [Heterocephalus glaber]